LESDVCEQRMVQNLWSKLIQDMGSHKLGRLLQNEMDVFGDQEIYEKSRVLHIRKRGDFFQQYSARHNTTNRSSRAAVD